MVRTVCRVICVFTIYTAVCVPEIRFYSPGRVSASFELFAFLQNCLIFMYWLSLLVSSYGQTVCSRVCRHHTAGLCDSYCHLVTQFSINWLLRRFYFQYTSEQIQIKLFYEIHLDSTNLCQVIYTLSNKHNRCTWGKRNVFRRDSSKSYMPTWGEVRGYKFCYNSKHNIHFTIF